MLTPIEQLASALILLTQIFLVLFVLFSFFFATMGAIFMKRKHMVDWEHASTVPQVRARLPCCPAPCPLPLSRPSPLLSAVAPAHVPPPAWPGMAPHAALAVSWPAGSRPAWVFLGFNPKSLNPKP